MARVQFRISYSLSLHVLHVILLFSQCNKAGGLLGHRNDLMSGPVDNVFTSLNTQSIPQRVKEIQAVQLMFEALLGKLYSSPFIRLV